MSSQGESRSTPTALETTIEVERCNGESGPHAALQQYAQLDRRVRAALDLPALPDTPNPDAFALARTVACLFQRFLNACAEAGVDSSAPWIKAVAEAEEAMTADKDLAEPQALDQPPTPSQSPAQELEVELAAARSPIPSVANVSVIDSAPNTSTPEREPNTPVTTDPSSSTQADISSSTQASTSSSTQASSCTSTSSSTTTATSTSTSQSTSRPTSKSTSTSTSTSTPTIDAARPHIRALLSVPDLDWTTLSTKDVRAQLVARGVGFDAAWVWERRRELRTVIEEEFDAAHTRWQAAQAAANPSAASPSQSGPAASQTLPGDSPAPPTPQLEASSSGDASSSHAAQHTENKLEAVGPCDDTPTKCRSIVPPRRPSSHSSQTHAEDGAVALSAEDQAVSPVGSAEDETAAPVGSAADETAAPVGSAEDETAAPVGSAEHEDVAPDAADLESPPTKRAKKRKVGSLLKAKLEPTSPISRSTRSSTRTNSKALPVLSRLQQSEAAAQPTPNSRPSALATRPTSGTGIKLRIPSLAARQAKSASKSPLPATSPKRRRSPTPDSDEDEFAASFMRKRKVSAAAV